MVYTQHIHSKSKYFICMVTMVYTHIIHCIRRKILKNLSNEPWATQAETRSSCAILASRSPSRSTPGIYMIDTDALMKVHSGCWFIFGIYLYTYHIHCIFIIFTWYIHGIFHPYMVYSWYIYGIYHLYCLLIHMAGI